MALGVSRATSCRADRNYWARGDYRLHRGHDGLGRRSPSTACADPCYSPPFASIVVDGNSGKTLQQTNADLPRHPASLTKIMTLYMLFERAGIRPHQARHRNGSVRARLGTGPDQARPAPGSTLAVEDAIKGLGHEVGQ